MPPTAGETTTSILPNAASRLARQRAAQPLGAGRVLEDEHLLQEHRRMQAGRENEMPLEQRAGGAEFGERLFRREVAGRPWPPS